MDTDNFLQLVSGRAPTKYADFSKSTYTAVIIDLSKSKCSSHLVENY